MALSTSVLAALIATCAPGVHGHTMAEVVRVESKGETLAINVNKARRQPPAVGSIDEAAKVVRWYMARGHSVDVGLVQLNSQHFDRLGLSVESAFDPCANLAAGARILTDAYLRASQGRSDEQGSLRAALSAYNTGSQVRGFLNGYVARFYPDGMPKRDAVEIAAIEPAASDDGIGSVYAATVMAIVGEEAIP